MPEMPDNLNHPEPAAVTPPTPAAPAPAPEPIAPAPEMTSSEPPPEVIPEAQAPVPEEPSPEPLPPEATPEAQAPLPPNPDVIPEAVVPAVEAAPPAAETPVAHAPGSPEGMPEGTSPEAAPAEQLTNKRWYVVKVQSGREDTIKEAIERRVKIEGLEEYFGQIVIPVETAYEMIKGKRVKRKHKLFPGYLMVEVEYNDRILYLFRETSGVGDFVGHTVINGVNRPPTPMTSQEVERMLHKVQPTSDEPAAGTTKFTKPRNIDVGDRVRVNDGTFAGMEGDVKEIVEAKAQVKVELHIFGRPVSVDLEYWQIERV